MGLFNKFLNDSFEKSDDGYQNNCIHTSEERKMREFYHKSRGEEKNGPILILPTPEFVLLDHYSIEKPASERNLKTEFLNLGPASSSEFAATFFTFYFAQFAALLGLSWPDKPCKVLHHGPKHCSWHRSGPIDRLGAIYNRKPAILGGQFFSLLLSLAVLSKFCSGVLIR